MINEPKHYEFTFIIPGNLPENEHQVAINKLKSLLETNQATNIAPLTEIGRKKLAYPIKSLRQGFYFSWEFDLLPQSLPAIEKDLRIDKNILRYLIIKKRIKTSEEIAKEKRIKDLQIKEQLVKEKAATAKKPTRIEKGKVSLDDLDKKLDELLSEEIK